MFEFLSRPVARVIIAFPLAATFALSACSDSATAPVSPTTTSPAAPVPAPTPAPAAPVSSGSGSVLVGAALWTDPASQARATANAWRSSRPADAAELDKIAGQPQARWFGDWNADIAADVRATTNASTAAGAVPVLVAYNIPDRDCGGYSGGNAVSTAAYQKWISAFASGIGSSRAVVVLEPDALAGMDCLSAADQQTRIALIAYAVNVFAKLGATSVYIDAGHPSWQSAATMAARLTAAGIANAAGFSLNVSNFIGDDDNVSYGRQLSALVGGKHFIIDSSRNGLGATADMQWCNPAARALGRRPTTNTDMDGVDAFLWIKTPGESDGSCNGGPAAGVWWPEYALGLAQRAAY
jgi:endoglucanase